VAVLRQQVQAIHDGPAVGPIRIKYVLIACGVLGGLSAVLSIIFTLKNGLTGSRSLAQVVGPLAHAPDSLPPVDPHDAAHIKSYWLRNTEAEFWDALASFVEAEKPRSFQEQLLFSQLTLDMANAMPAATWVWNAPGDKVALVEQLADCIQKQGLSAAYRSLPGMTYGDAKPFPRSVAAELISLGLARWQQLYT